MNKNNISRFLSLILRHKPDVIGITLDKSGWVSVSLLLTQLKKYDRPLSLEELVDIVETNPKKRFTFNEDNTKIRANQGHSTEVDLEPEEPPTTLFHGTVKDAIPGIKKSGLDKMSRHALHLSVDLETATNVGSRRGKALILSIDSGKMHEDGYLFYKSKNGVWLIDNVPPEYIQFDNV